MDVIELTELLHVTGPGCELSLVDHGLRHMVDDDREIRVALYKADRVDDVPRLDQGVETQAERWRQSPCIRIPLGQLSYCF
jgi:hypothetical protein